ncbi:hypothetical protein A2634_01055 [Candidatus Amesbacteria bacterium RIFCSPHIGHO2_01_FULL_48_32]|uniref:O-antigen ligase-related domain-containing protein n=1 Tax=Candidatus Amesbacteria bacterium RIFCSPLOWO2_01_FULL_48_25 TaxID=1797259 RepID=A0A1F4ZBR3_9BACT|nr:MAG: hypothetical protein A2634_01055 [Candidatus Amesbacteria bacterium RIFCSPHIGHO2_01_FULL_48_32]OGD03628.1 MAG: hypothetical protein A2989_03035 [Candidatus Amesbacteria bacterium RIFCSPLOWO2_01_FULL_48_25]HJZ06025.1 O-antigen ligase family protein [Patescibacteria group bacterium]
MSWPSRIIRWSFYLLFFSVPLFFLSITSELFEFNKIILTYLITTVIVSSWLADCILQKKFVFRRTPLDWPLLIFLISQSLSLLFSISTHVSWHGYYSRFNGGLASLLAYSLLYWAYVTYMDRRSTLKLINYSLITSALVSIYGTLEHFGFSPSCVFTTGTWDVSCWVQDVQGRVFATLGQPNWMAAYLVALMFVPLSKILSSKKFPTIYYLLFTIYFSALLFTKSRSGLMAFGISSILFWGNLIIENLKNKNSLKISNLKLKILAFLALTLTLTLTINNPAGDFLKSRFKSSPPPPITTKTTSPTETSLETSGITESGNIRKIVWSGALSIWQASTKNFLVGTGPETFAMSYYQYRPRAHNTTTEWELLYNKAHNEFLNYLANTGLLGLLSYLVLLGFMIRCFFNNTPSEGALLTALFAGWLSISVTNFWGFSVVIIQIFLFLFPAMAIALNNEPQEHKSTQISKPQIFLLFIPGFAVCYLLFAISRYWLADVDYAAGTYNLRAFTATQEPKYLLSSYQSLTQAYEGNPAEPSIASDLSVTAAFLALASNESDPTSASQLARVAISASDKAASVNPYHPNIFKNRSRMFILLSDLDSKYLAQADEALAKATQISPTDPRIPYNRGIIAIYLDHPDLARQYFQASLDLKPDFNDPKVRLEELTLPAGRQATPSGDKITP